MHERFATEQTKKAVSMGFGIVDDPIQIIEFDHLTFGRHVDPTSFATQLTGVDDRDEEKRREMDTLFESTLKLLNGSHPLKAKVPAELPEKSRVGTGKHSAG
jgi:hypothetical protein